MTTALTVNLQETTFDKIRKETYGNFKFRFSAVIKMTLAEAN